MSTKKKSRRANSRRTQTMSMASGTIGKQRGPLRLDSLPPGFHSTAVPADYQGDPSLCGRYFYVLPIELIEAVIKDVGADRFSEDRMAKEIALSQAVGDLGFRVGYWDGQVISYHLLERRPPIEIDLTLANELGWNKNAAQLKEIARLGTQRLEELGAPNRGYLGWLVTNKTFLDEHDSLLRRHLELIGVHGIPRPLLSMPTQTTKQIDPSPAWVLEFREFFLRWRLQSLAGPNLPLPLELQIPMLSRLNGLNAGPGTITVAISDIHPNPQRGVFDATLEDALRGSAPPQHLADWIAIVRKGNTAKNAIGRFGRVFRLQHYWRLLHRRHSDELRQKKSALISAFATFFKVSDDSIKQDLRLIARRLGPDWVFRSAPLES